MGKVQAEVIFDYRKGMLPGVSGAIIADKGAVGSLNVRFNGGIIESNPGYYISYTEADSGSGLSFSSTDTPTALFFHTDYRQNINTILTSREKIFHLKSGATSWLQVGTWPTPFNQSYFPIVDGVGVTYVDGTTTKNSFIVTDGMNALQEVNLDARTLAPLGGSPPVCHTITEFFSHLLLGHTDVGSTPESPYRIQWSDTGKYNVWTGGNSGFMDLADGFGPVVGFEHMGDRLYVYKSNCIYEVLYVGPPRMFDAHLVVAGTGTVSSKTVTHSGTSHYFLGSNGQVYEFNGRELKVVSEQIVSMVGHFSRAQVVFHPVLQEVWLLGVTHEGFRSFPDLATGSGTYLTAVGSVYSASISPILRLYLPTSSWWASSTYQYITCMAYVPTTKTAYHSLTGPELWLTTSSYSDVSDPAQRTMSVGVGPFAPNTTAGNLGVPKGFGAINYRGFFHPNLQNASLLQTAYYEFGDLSLGMSERVTEILVEAEIFDLNQAYLKLFLAEGYTLTSLGYPTKVFAETTSLSSPSAGRWFSWSTNVTLTNVRVVLVWENPSGASSTRIAVRRIVVRFIPRKRPFLAPITITG